MFDNLDPPTKGSPITRLSMDPILKSTPSAPAAGLRLVQRLRRLGRRENIGEYEDADRDAEQRPEQATKQEPLEPPHVASPR
jgi:hypothetical protein